MGRARGADRVDSPAMSHPPFTSMRRAFVLAVVVAGCGDKKGTDSSAAASGPAATSSSSSAGSAPRPADASPPPKETGAIASMDPTSVGALKERATKVMDALKRGEAKAAADFCLGKHRDALEKYIQETIDKKEQSRAKGYAAWDGKLQEIRVKDDLARVKFGEAGTSIDYLSFRKKDTGWSLDDIPVAQKPSWEKWGTVATE